MLITPEGLRLRQKKAHGDASLGTSPEEQCGPAKSKLSQTLQVILIFVLINFALSKIITEDWVWGYRGKWYYTHNKEKAFTTRELSQYDGSDPAKPLYISVFGVVYDVSEGRRFYGPSGPYAFLAGRDASRTFATACTHDERHYTHDMRGLSEDEQFKADTWAAYFENSPKYPRKGHLLLPEIDPRTPIPPPCDVDGGY